MVDNSINNKQFNRLLINVGRSFLQYVGECWPWTQVDANAERDKINDLVARQQTQIARLVELLVQRDGGAIDFGSYPTEYTDLHYVSLDYLLAQLIENEQLVVAEIDASRRSATDDSEAAELLDQIHSAEQANLKELQDLAASRKADRAAESAST